MTKELKAIQISVLVILCFGVISFFETGFFIPLLPGIDLAIILLSFLFAFWNWKKENSLSIGAIIFGIGFLSASFSIWETLLGYEQLEYFNKSLIFDYFLIAKAISILTFSIVCAVQSKQKKAQLCYLIGGIGLTCFQLINVSYGIWWMVFFTGICSIPRIKKWDKNQVPLLWSSLFLFILIIRITYLFSN